MFSFLITGTSNWKRKNFKIIFNFLFFAALNNYNIVPIAAKEGLELIIHGLSCRSKDWN
jgi:hypothetical protein